MSITPAASGDPRPSVLLIDEDAESLTAMEAAFAAAGWRVGLAPGGCDAVERLAREGFDLIVTEVLMERQEGIALIQSLKRAVPNVPILAVSAGGRLPANQILRLAEALGANASLGKPLAMTPLIDLASSLLKAGR